MMNASTKLGLNSVSSTETYIASNGERFPKCTWFRYFRLAQGGTSKEDVLMQYNTCCILMHNNYPFSIIKGSKHINIRHFFVADKITKKEVRVVHCPTDKMIANNSTKPTQGTLFVFQFNSI